MKNILLEGVWAGESGPKALKRCFISLQNQPTGEFSLEECFSSFQQAAPLGLLIPQVCGGCLSFGVEVEVVRHAPYFAESMMNVG
jgi:hypothetical protein